MEERRHVKAGASRNIARADLNGATEVGNKVPQHAEKLTCDRIEHNMNPMAICHSPDSLRKYHVIGGVEMIFGTPVLFN